MTLKEAGQVVGYLNAVFPREALEAETVAVWAAEIAELLNYEAAMQAAREIGRGQKKFPALTDYLATYRIVRDRMAPRRPEIEQVASGERELHEQVREWLAARGGLDGMLRDIPGRGRR